MSSTIPNLLTSVKRLLDAQVEFEKCFNTLSDAGIELNLNIDLVDIALDLLQVPEDTAPVGMCEGEYPEGTYLRDWAYDAWAECNGDINKFMLKIIKNNTKGE